MKLINTDEPLENLNVLVADDELFLLNSLTFTLKGIGANVSVAQNGKEAFTKIKNEMKSNNSFDLLLLDIKMPQLSGIQLLTLLSQNKINIPVILMSNYNTSMIKKQLAALNILAILPKPFSKKELINIIERFKKKVTDDNLSSVQK